MGYLDLGTFTPGTPLPAATLTKARDNDEWMAVSRPHCRVYKTTSTTLTHNVANYPSYDGERVDVGAMHSTGTNPNRITIPAGAGGWYDIGAWADFTANSTGLRAIIFRLNGAGLLHQQNDTPANATTWYMGAHFQYQLAAGDYFEVGYFQTSGGNLNVNTQEVWATWQTT